MFEYSEELDPTTGTTIIRLLAISSFGALLPLIGAFLPRDDVVLWQWVAVGVAIMALIVASGFRHIFAILDSAAMFTPNPIFILAQNCVTYFALASFAYGLSGSVGIYRLIMLAPLLFMAVIGNRLMFGISYACCMVALGLSTAGNPNFDLSVFPAFIIAYSIGFLTAAIFVRELSTSAVRSVRQAQRYADLTMIAAQADSLESGLEELLPVACEYMNATALSAYEVVARRVNETPLASFPANRPNLDETQLGDLRTAVRDRKVISSDHWTCIPVHTTEGIPLVLFAECEVPDFLRRVMYQDSVERIGLQLGALFTRLSLIERLESLTKTDTLTELPNRRALTERLQRDLAVAGLTESPLCVVMIDLDHFKDYNDSYGHLAGDDVLKLIADMLRVRLRATDFVARYGGEEFCALIPFTELSDAAVVMKELHRRSHELLAHRVITFSAGIAQWNGAETVEELIDRADQALYDAKATGRDQSKLSATPAAPPTPRPAVAVKPVLLKSTIAFDSGFENDDPTKA